MISSELNDNAIIFKPVNVNHSKQLTIALAYSPNIGQWNPNLRAGLNKPFLHLNGLHYNKTILAASVKNIIKLPKHWQAHIDAAYKSKGNYQIITLDETFTLDLAIAKSVNDKLRFNVKATDLLYSSNNRKTFIVQNVQNSIRKNFDSRKIRLTVSYTLNTNNKYKGQQASNELNRL
jgi:hypothetical protein